MIELLALVFPLLALAVAFGWTGPGPLTWLIGALFLSEWLVWALAAADRLPRWLIAPRYTLAEARHLPRMNRRPLLIAHFLLFLLAIGLLLHSFSFSGGRFLALAICFCQGHVLAHEMSHTRRLRSLTAVLYGIIGGTEGYVNHLQHHHVHYATPADELNAYFDEPYYRLDRRLRFQWNNARHADTGMLARGYAIQGLAAVVACLLGGVLALIAYLLSVVIARLFIEAFSVVTHYRLHRRDRALAVSAWEVHGRNLFDYFGGYRSTRHPAHHAKGGLPSVHLAQTPQMPAFLTLLTLVWLAPPLLRVIMDRQLLVYWRDHESPARQLSRIQHRGRARRAAAFDGLDPLPSR